MSHVREFARRSPVSSRSAPFGVLNGDAGWRGATVVRLTGTSGRASVSVGGATDLSESVAVERAGKASNTTTNSQQALTKMTPRRGDKTTVRTLPPSGAAVRRHSAFSDL